MIGSDPLKGTSMEHTPSGAAMSVKSLSPPVTLAASLTTIRESTSAATTMIPKEKISESSVLGSLFRSAWEGIKGAGKTLLSMPLFVIAVMSYILAAPLFIVALILDKIGQMVGGLISPEAAETIGALFAAAPGLGFVLLAGTGDLAVEAFNRIWGDEADDSWVKSEIVLRFGFGEAKPTINSSPEYHEG